MGGQQGESLLVMVVTGLPAPARSVLTSLFLCCDTSRICFRSWLRGKSLRSLPADYLRWTTNTLHWGRSFLSVGRAKDLPGEHSTLGNGKAVITQTPRRVALTQEAGRDRKPVSRSLRKRETHDCAQVCGDGQLKEAVNRLCLLDADVGCPTYASLLRCCGRAKAIWHGKSLHAHIIRAGYGKDRFLGNLLVQMYGKCGYAVDARGVFDKIPQPNIFSWNIMIAAYSQNGHCKEALELFQQMQLNSVAPDRNTFINILHACACLANLAEGKKSHAHIISRRCQMDVDVDNAIINMYGKCGSLHDARSIFDKIPQRDVVSWNTMIAAYSKNGHYKNALELFQQMQLKGEATDKITLIGVVVACTGLAALAEGKESHANIINSGFEMDTVVGNALVNMYGKCGSPDDARSVFEKMPQRSGVSWTTMIAVYAQNGHGNKALDLFGDMQLKGMTLDKVTFISILDACSSTAAIAEGKECHAMIIDNGFETDVVVGTALVNMYGKCGSLTDARSVFDKMAQRNVVTWTAMIAVYAQNGHGKEGLELFRRMQLTGVQPNKITFVSILDACTEHLALAEGREIHASIIDRGFESDVIVGTALVNIYGKCGSLDDARSMFDKMPHRNVVSWNTLIAAYAQNGYGKMALELFPQMQLNGVEADKITFISILDAYASLVALAEGKESHASVIDSGFETNIVVGTALVNMYGKCGSLQDARTVFDKMPQHDVVLWDTMIAAYSHNGHAKEALELFEQMQVTGVEPDKITFISILSGCSHTGLVDDGWHYFVSMNREYDITPTLEHFVCMIDLLGRAGHLDEAEQLISTMPFEPPPTAWISLLGACRIYGVVEQGVCIAEHIFELDSKIAAPYVLLSNIYAAAGNWDGVAKVRKAMTDRHVKNYPGCSSIEINERVHEFVAGDTLHPQKEEIYDELQRLSRQMEEAGYMPNTKAVLHDAEEVNKKRTLSCHSEKLAIAFGLISTQPGSPLRIINNLRVCADCHAATKFISKIVKRKIILRDANRFHHFDLGVCSCGDYW